MPRAARTAALTLALLAPAIADVALAQVPGAGGLSGAAGKGATTPAPAPEDPQQARAAIEREIARLRERLDRVESGSEPPPPPGIAAAELENARKVVALLAYSYEGHLDTLKQVENARQVHEAAEQAQREWPGFPGKPPYSILLLDDAREQAASHRATVAALKASRTQLDTEFQWVRARAERAAEAVRRAAEAAESAAPGTDARSVAEWRLGAARDNAKLAAEFLVTGTLLSQELDAKLATAQAELGLAERKLAALAGKTRIDAAEVEEAKKRLDALRQQRDKELKALLKASSQRLRERDQAQKALAALRAAGASAQGPPTQDLAVKRAEARLRAAEDWMHGLHQQIRMLTALVNTYYPAMAETWGWRHTVLAGDDPDARQQARRQIDEVTQLVRAWNSRAATQLIELRSAIREQHQRVLSASDEEIEKHERSSLEAMQQLDNAIDQMQTTVLERRLQRLDDWKQDFTEALRTRSPGDIAADILARLKVIAKEIWEYELLTIEDTTEVGGKIVTTSRGITVGKSIGAFLLFLLGYRLLSFGSVRAEKFLVRRFGVGEEQGKTIRRWTNVVGLVALLLVTLNVARIPLTVFAFAGGALAIGIGFGTQTLIKNLISGMIVLVERNVRVGDIIEVQGVTGTVTAVDIRSSTVRGFDGVENLIPNSMLLEDKVTNWTLSSGNVRRVVKVGVAYGSPVRQVSEILAECAKRHGKVLGNPAPRIIFEDFGDNSLVFALYFWIDLTPDTNTLQVMSDLRFMIEKALREADIAVAFPQRDIHLDTTEPLKIEVVSPGGSPA